MKRILSITVTLEEDGFGRIVCDFSEKTISVDHAALIASNFLYLAASNCEQGWEKSVQAIVEDAEAIYRK